MKEAAKDWGGSERLGGGAEKDRGVACERLGGSERKATKKEEGLRREGDKKKERRQRKRRGQ